MTTVSSRPSTIKALALVASFVALLATLAATSPTHAATGRAGAGTITIGVLNSLSGLSQPICGEEVRGMDLAVAEAGHMKVNGARYLGGVGVKLDQQDDQSTAAGGATGYKALVDGSASAIVGPCSGVITTAIQPQLDSNKVPVVMTEGQSLPALASEYGYAGGVQYGYISGRVIQVMRGAGYKSVYFIYSQDQPVIVDVWNAMKKTVNVLGMKITGDFPTTARTTDYTAAIQQIQQQKPDAIGLLVRGSQGLPALTQLRNAGITTPVFGHAGFYAAGFLGGGAVVKGVWLPTPYATVFTFKPSTAFTKAFKTKFDADATAAAAVGYDSMWRVLRAIHDAGPAKVAAASTSQQRELVKKALDTQKAALGAEGPLHYLPDGEAISPGGVIQITDDKGTQKNVKVPPAKSLKKLK